MRPTFDALSTEHVVAVLRELHYTRIVHCREVCKRIRSIIDDTPELQCIIELGAAGLLYDYEHSLRAAGPAEILDRHRRVQQMFRNPKPRISHVVDFDAEYQAIDKMTPCLRHWFICGDKLIGYVTLSTCLRIFSFGPSVPTEERLRTIDLGVKFTRVFVDPVRQLVIAQGFDQKTLHFRSLENGRAHLRVGAPLVNGLVLPSFRAPLGDIANL